MKFQEILVLAASTILHLSNSHPLCLDSSGPSEDKKNQMKFCTEIKDWSNKDGACCTQQQEAEEKRKYYDPYNLSDKCKPYQRQVACGKCHPYSTHMFSDGSGIIGMSKDFCWKYMDACKADMKLPDDFCNKHATDSFYAYPFNSAQIPTVRRITEIRQ